MRLVNADDMLLPPQATLRDALATIDRSARKIALALDDDGRLAGLITDGDIRRAILSGSDLNDPVAPIINRVPKTVDRKSGPREVSALMRQFSLLQVPAVDDDHRPVGVWLRVSGSAPFEHDVPVVIMAGGEGKRLRPLTENCPKPLLELGDKVILERILEQFVVAGFHTFYVSVNYLGHMIEDYFGDGSAWGVDINYLQEEKMLGTAGSLSLLPTGGFDHVIVMNGDIITDMDFVELVSFHVDSQATATMCVREYRQQFPFGVVDFDGYQYNGIVEKPSIQRHVNAGIYCLSAPAIGALVPNSRTDMPDLFTQLALTGHNCAVHQILGARWIDIGTIEQLNTARSWINQR